MALKPITRQEKIIAGQNLTPITRMEKFLKEFGGSGGGGGIPVPETAEVGQTIVVKAVDENGKPTEWECVGFPASEVGTKSYTDLTNKPSINGVELSGKKTSADLGIGVPTDDQVNAAVDKFLDSHYVSALRSEEKEVLLTLFKNAVYSTDVSSVVATLENMWGSNSSTVYSVTNTLTDAVNSNTETSVNKGESYTAIITPALAGYNLRTVTVTIGGEDATNIVCTFDKQSTEINIPMVTGDIVITAIAVEKETTYLYLNGDECTAVTGGWVEKGYRQNTDLATVSKTPQLHLEAVHSSPISATLATANTIDITNYKRLVVDGTFSNTVGSSGMVCIYLCNQVVNAGTSTNAFGQNRVTAFKLGENMKENLTLDLTTLDLSALDKTKVYVAVVVSTWGATTVSATINSMKFEEV